MTTNQNLKPISATTVENTLYIGGCNTVELTQKYGTPLYVIDELTLRTMCREFKHAFAKYPNVNILYASKALATSGIFRIIHQEGVGLDVVSGGEIFTAQKAQVDFSKVLFNGNNKQLWELELAINLNIGRISVDNFNEIKLLSELANKFKKPIDILLRVTPGIDCHTHEYIQTGQLDSKFGFDLSQIDEAINDILKNPLLNLKGLHAHIGSQIFDDAGFKDEVKILVKELARINTNYNLNLNELNLGGGFGVKYTEADTPPDINKFAESIIDTLNTELNKHNLQNITIYIEPGRSLISTSGVTLYTIGSEKQVPNSRKYVSVDGGMADNPRPALYQAKYSCDIANKMNDEKSEIVTIAGKYCESGDILIQDTSLQKTCPGDILCVYNTGAYNYSMASNYSKSQKPAMVLVNNSQSDIIVYRETLEDIISRDNIPDRLK